MPINQETLTEYDFLKDLPWLEHRFFGNTAYAYILTAISFVILWAVLHLARGFAFRRLTVAVEHGGGETWSFLRTLIYQIRPYMFPLVAAYLTLERLNLPRSFSRVMHGVVIVLVTVQVVRLAVEMLGFLIMRTRAIGRADDLMVVNTSKNIIVLMKVAVWTAALLFLLDNAGYNVSTFIAGLGIGGVAIALAAQAILGDTFSSFAIALDKPFEVGDFIVVDTLAGAVEHIGLKTTRVRSVGGELLIFSNSDLTKSRIQNYKRMLQRRALFRIAVPYETPTETLKTIPEMIKAAVEAVAETRFDRAHFAAFGDCGLIFETVYYVLKPDYALAMDAQQAINLQLRDALAAVGVELVRLPATATAATGVGVATSSGGKKG